MNRRERRRDAVLAKQKPAFGSDAGVLDLTDAVWLTRVAEKPHGYQYTVDEKGPQ